jgi:hypothetical protein
MLTGVTKGYIRDKKYSDGCVRERNFEEVRKKEW